MARSGSSNKKLMFGVMDEQESNYMIEESQVANINHVSGASSLLDDSNEVVDFADCIEGA